MSVLVVDESGAVEVVLPSPPPGTVVVVDMSLPDSIVVVGAGELEPGIVVDGVASGLEVAVVLAAVVVVVDWVVVVGAVVVVVGGRVVVVVVVDSTNVPRISMVSTNTSLLRRRPEKRKRTRKFSELKSLTSILACWLIPEDS